MSSPSDMYDYWCNAYMTNAVTLKTLEKLVAAGKLTQSEVDGMVADRISEYGF